MGVWPEDPGEFWTMVGALGTFTAVVYALYQTRQANSQRQEAEKAHRRRLYQSILVEIKENRKLLNHPINGASLARLHREAWEVSRAEAALLPPNVLDQLLEAYRAASTLNDVVDVHLADQPVKGYHAELYKTAATAAVEPFEKAEEVLGGFLNQPKM